MAHEGACAHVLVKHDLSSLLQAKQRLKTVPGSCLLSREGAAGNKAGPARCVVLACWVTGSPNLGLKSQFVSV